MQRQSTDSNPIILNILDFPLPTILNIFSRIPLKDIKNILLVSKKTKEIITSNQFWELKYLQHFSNWYAETKKENPDWHQVFLRDKAKAYAFPDLNQEEKPIVEELFTLLKEGNLTALKARENQLKKYFEIKDASNLSLIDWAYVKFKETNNPNFKNIFNYLFYNFLVPNIVPQPEILLFAIKYNFSENKIRLLAVNTLRYFDRTPINALSLGLLQAAALYSSPDIMQVLIGLGVNVDLIRAGATALIHAIENNKPEAVKVLLKNGANVAIALKFRGSLSKELADYHAKYHAYPGDTALHIAAKLDCTEMMADLLAAAANVDLLNANGVTAIFCAVQFGNRKIVQEILKYNPLLDISIKNKYFSNNNSVVGDNVFHTAAVLNHAEIMQDLLTAQPNHKAINQSNSAGFTPLMLAVSVEALDIVRTLLFHQAKVESASIRGRTALHLAANNGNVKIAKVLIAYGASSTATDDKKRTPLHYAAKKGFSELVELFLEHNADINARDAARKTAFELAIKYKKYDVVVKLLRKGALTSLPSFTPEEIEKNATLTLFNNIHAIEHLVANEKLIARTSIIEQLKYNASKVREEFNYIDVKTNELLSSIVDVKLINKLDKVVGKFLEFLDNPFDADKNVGRKFAIDNMYAIINSAYSENRLAHKLEKELEKLTDSIQNLDALTNRFAHILNLSLDTEKNPQRVAAINHLKIRIDQAYKGEVSYLDLEQELTTFANADYLASKTLGLVYQGKNSHYQSILTSITETINKAYSDYIKANGNIEKINFILSDLQRLIGSTLSNLVTQHQNKFGKKIRLFGTSETDDNFILSIQNTITDIKNNIINLPKQTLTLLDLLKTIEDYRHKTINIPDSQNREDKLAELTQLTKEEIRQYNGNITDGITLALTLESKLKLIRKSDDLIARFKIDFTNENIFQKKSLEKLKFLIDKAYKEEINLFDLERQLAVFAELEYMTNSLLSITDSDGNEKSKEVKIEILSIVEDAFTIYASDTVLREPAKAIKYLLEKFGNLCTNDKLKKENKEFFHLMKKVSQNLYTYVSPLSAETIKLFELADEIETYNNANSFSVERFKIIYILKAKLLNFKHFYSTLGYSDAIELMTNLASFKSLDEYVKSTILSLERKDDSEERKVAIDHLKELANKAYNHLSHQICPNSIGDDDKISISDLENAVELFYQIDMIAKPFSTLTYDGVDPTYVDVLPKIQVRAAEAYVTYATASNIAEEKRAAQTLLEAEASIFNSTFSQDNHLFYFFKSKEDKAFYSSLAQIHEQVDQDQALAKAMQKFKGGH